MCDLCVVVGDDAEVTVGGRPCLAVMEDIATVPTEDDTGIATVPTEDDTDIATVPTEGDTNGKGLNHT